MIKLATKIVRFFFCVQGSKNWLKATVGLNTTEISLRVQRRIKISTKACFALKTMCYKEKVHPLLEEKFSDPQCINTGLFSLSKAKNYLRCKSSITLKSISSRTAYCLYI